MLNQLRSVISNVQQFLNAGDPTDNRYYSDGSAGWPSIRRTTSGQYINDEQAMREATVFGCLRVLSENVAQLPKHLMRITGGMKNKDTASTLYNVLAYSPCSYMTSFDYWKFNVLCLMLRGFYLSEKLTRFSDKKITGLLPMHPNLTTIGIHNTGDLYFDTVACKDVAVGHVGEKYKRRLEFGEVLYGMYATMNGVNPVTPITYNAECIGNAKEMREYNGTLMRNNMMPSGALELTKKLKSDTARASLRKSWQREYGDGNRGNIAILEEGTTFKQISMSAEDSQYLETRQYTKEEICGMFGVNPNQVGDTKQAKGWSTVEQSNQAFNSTTLSPIDVRIEQSIRLCLIPRKEWARSYVNIDEKQLLRADLKTMTSFYEKMIDKTVWSPDEVRDDLEMNPRPDGRGGEYWVQPGAATEEEDPEEKDTEETETEGEENE